MLSVPPTMRCIELTGFGGPDVMHEGVRPTPRPAPGEVLVHVVAAGVNRPDLLQRQGKYPPPAGAPDTLGLDIAGTVAAVGPGVDRWKLDDAVCALVAGGGYAEYCVVPAPQLLPVPQGLTMVAAAALPETFFTVWTNLFQRARLVAGDSVLIHGGSSGIGTTAIQLAHAFGARVFATAGTDAKCAACRELGAHVAINYRDQDFVEVIAAATGGMGVAVILDMVGGPYFQRNLAALAVEGRLAQIAFQQGSRIEIDLHPLMAKRLTITGSTLRPRTPAQKGEIARELEARVWPLLAAGTVRPVVAHTFPLAQAAEAHRLLESGAVVGKLVLIV